MNTKIRVTKSGYFAGGYHAEGSEIELTPRQLECVERRERGFEVIEDFSADGGPKMPSPENVPPVPAPSGGTTKVANLKTALDDAGVEYPANAKKAELQALVDGLSDQEGM